MANGFSQVHNLSILLNNKRFENVLPQFKVKKTHEGTKVSVTSKSLYKMVYQYAKMGATGHYKPLQATMSGKTITISGTPITTLKEAYDSVYNIINSNKSFFMMVANNNDILRSALKYSETMGLKGGKKPKLYLKEGMFRNINKVPTKEKEQFISEVLDNIRYSDQFKKIQEQYGLQNEKRYEINKYKWQMKVGETV